MNNKKCVICGFNKKVELHHIIKYLDYGSNDENNLVYLCRNHHWIADFGDKEDRILLLSKIKKLTKKEGMIDYKKKKYYEKLIKVLIEYYLNYSEGMSNNEWETNFNKKSYNYKAISRVMLSKSGNFEYPLKNSLIEKGEILYLIKLLKNRLYLSCQVAITSQENLIELKGGVKKVR